MERQVRSVGAGALMACGLAAGEVAGALAALPYRDAGPARARGLAVVYRRRNEATVLRLLRAVAPTQVALWALDEVSPELAPLTLGCGPGTRLELLSRLTAAVGDCDDLVVADDDVVLTRAAMNRCLRVAAGLGLDIVQPAQCWRSRGSWPFVQQRLGVVARRTTFVESGPLVVLNRRGRNTLLPFPEELGMGWGIEAQWSSAEADGEVSLGIVDCAPMLHKGVVAADYRREGAEAAARAELALQGHRWFADIQHTRRQIRAQWRFRLPHHSSTTSKKGAERPVACPRVLLTVNASAADAAARKTDFSALSSALHADVVDWRAADATAVGRWARRRLGFGPVAAAITFRRRSRYEVVFCFSEVEGLILALLFKLSRTHTGLLIIGIELLSPKVLFILRWLRVWTHLSALLPTSTYQAGEVVRRSGMPAAKVVVLPYQVDAVYFRRPAGRPRGDGGYVVAAGLESRDYTTLFTAARELDADVRIAAGSAWAGRPPTWDADDRPANVDIRHYKLPSLRDLYAGAALAVVPLHESPYQHGVTALQEAMAMSLPVVVTRTLGQGDIVVDRRRRLRDLPERATLGCFSNFVQPRQDDHLLPTGLYVPPGDPAALRRSIEYLLAHPDLATELGDNGARIAREMLSTERFAERVVRLVRAVATGESVTDALIWEE